MFKKHTLTVFLLALWYWSFAGTAISYTEVCYGSPSLLINQSNVPATQLVEWDLNNDGFFNDATGDTVNHTFLSADTFKIRLKITDSTGAITYSLTPHLVVVHPVPITKFSYVNTCLGTSTVFNNLSTIVSGSINSFQWDFDGNGTTDATSASPTFLYGNSGIFKVTLTSESTLGCFSTDSGFVPITVPPIASFNAGNSCAKSPVTLINNSQFFNSAAKQTTWFLGDGGLSFATDTLMYTYSVAGSYTVTLVVIDTNNCADSAGSSVFIDSTVNYSYQLTPSNQVYEGQVVTATVSGDVSTIVWQDSTTNLTNTFNTAGSFSFEVTNASGCKANGSFTITHLQKPSILSKANDFVTPNGDGKNDVLYFDKLEAFANCKLTVFDERGLLVYVNNNYTNDWNADVNAGTYYYIIQCDSLPELRSITHIIK
ncbi:MAG: gliding motility-associated C-terminal domain-containing protein [Chitinophagales bacterium]|nr:gliding motility-associated C-terminal domain-containing protein [Chitinophagales bacterium]